jgi:Flp pilus assembly pilin Flp
VFRRMLQAVSRVTARLREEVGQTTAEYALVILGAAAVATLLITWATKSHAVGKLFDEVIGKVLQ